MSTLKIEERFSLDADPDRVFGYLTDPERIVVCLPGASLDEVLEDGSYAGQIKVKLGSVSIAYRGTMRFIDVDEESRVVRLEGTGKERAGGGSVKMTMESRVLQAGSGSEVTVDADVQLAGKVVRFARGMLQNVSQGVFREFTECLATMIEADADGAPGSGPAPQARELNAARLLWQAFVSWLKGLFRRG